MFCFFVPVEASIDPRADGKANKRASLKDGNCLTEGAEMAMLFLSLTAGADRVKYKLRAGVKSLSVISAHNGG